MFDGWPARFCVLLGKFHFINADFARVYAIEMGMFATLKWPFRLRLLFYIWFYFCCAICNAPWFIQSTIHHHFWIWIGIFISVTGFRPVFGYCYECISSSMRAGVCIIAIIIRSVSRLYYIPNRWLLLLVYEM